MNAFTNLLLLSLGIQCITGFLSEGPTCYSCSGVSDPSSCTNQQQCQFGQACFTERLVSSSLQETYNLGCQDSVTCSQADVIVGKRNVRTTYHDVTARDVTTCRRCCTGSSCNRNVCADASSVQSYPSSQEVYVRLIGGGNAYEGTVEVFYNGHWGSVCDDHWLYPSAKVVCRMIGYTDVGVGAVTGGYLPPSGTQRIWLDEVRCVGNETSIADCPKSAWGDHDCSHSEDAGVICNPVTTQDDVIYLVDTGVGGVLIRMNLLTQSYVPIPINTIYHPSTFDYDPVQGRLYFADGVLKEIVSIRYTGKDPKILKQLDADATVEKLEVDPLNRILFFTDDGNDVIGSMNLDGSNFRQIITTNLDKPREIVLDPRNRNIYWTDWGKTPKIETSDYDGNNRRTLVSSDIVWPNGLAMDYAANRIYFVDGGTHKIEEIDLQGGSRRVILEDSSAHFFSLDVFGQYIYYTDWNQNTVMRVKKDGTERTAVGPPSFRQLADIRVHKYETDLPGLTTLSPIHFDPEHVFVRVHGPATTGYVEVYANGQWGTICDDHWDAHDAAVICRMVGLNPTGARAVGNSRAGHGSHDLIFLDEVSCNGDEEHIVQCGITLDDWGRHDCSHQEDAGVICTVDNTGDDFLLFTSGGLLNRMSMNTYSYTVIPIPNDQPNPIAIVYNPNDHRVYFTEVMQSPGSQIYSSDLDGQHAVLIKQLPLNSVADGLDVDTVNNKLFYTDTGSDVIVSMNLDGTNEQTIVSSGLDEPRAIVADPHNRVLYWTDWGSNPKIERINYDGSNRQTLVDSGLQLPNGLELDTDAGVLYFCDAGTHLIESVTISGGDRSVIFQDNGAHFFDMFLSGNYIYYTDWRRHGVLRINKDGSGQTMVGPPSFGRISGITGYSSSG